MANASSHTSFKVNDIATITGRFGLASGPLDRTLWYVKGGAAYERLKVDARAQANFIDCTVVFFAFCDSGSVHGAGSENFSRWGWTVGTGVEFGLWDNWSAKVEYDYMQFKSDDLTFAGNGQGCVLSCDIATFNEPFSVNTTIKNQIQVVKIGLNYRFNWGKAPVAY